MPEMPSETTKQIGLTTEEAFDRLFQELTSKLANFKATVGRYCIVTISHIKILHLSFHSGYVITLLFDITAIG